ncbi:hypothetical protein GCM10023321_64010 [Pseudonocardia eucalypti]|uniref:Phage integrase family protein n=1 Tax=Pseudonocardia eucalypti TaxID=648755 RepID=A0ABP9QXH8_9PSEU
MEEWARHWLAAADVAPATFAQYRSLTRAHLVPRWGTVALGAISGIAARQWAVELRGRGYADSTVRVVMRVLSMMLADAAREGLIAASPMWPPRRGRRRRPARREMVWANPEQVLRTGLHACALAGGWAGLLVVSAAWTGARWGELLGLRRENLHLDPAAGVGELVIDPVDGALHEIDGHFSLGPPKTAASARTVTLPPFLVALLARHLATHDHPYVFASRQGRFPRRSNFARRAMRPAADGTEQRAWARIRLPAVVPGLTFQGLRHSHKTWLVTDGIAPVAQARRLGHALPDRIDDIYSHVAPELEARVLACLQWRWEQACQALARDPVRVDAPVWARRLDALADPGTPGTGTGRAGAAGPRRARPTASTASGPTLAAPAVLVSGVPAVPSAGAAADADVAPAGTVPDRGASGTRPPRPARLPAAALASPRVGAIRAGARRRPRVAGGGPSWSGSGAGTPEQPRPTRPNPAQPPATPSA